MLAYNLAYERVLRAPRMTVGLMSPLARSAGHMADIATEAAAAKCADALGFAALWARDVPLMVPQGSASEAVALDDPLVWLGYLSALTTKIALGTAAVVLPLRNPLHLAKSALSLDRLSGGRFLFGLGSGDREAEFAAFGVDPARRNLVFQDHWALLRSALSPAADARTELLQATGGFDIVTPPSHRIPMLAVGTARQSLQWIAANSDGWATYHREDARQQGRIGLWSSALAQRSEMPKPFIQSLHLELTDDPDVPPTPIELGLRVGRKALVSHLLRLESLGVAHVLLNLGATHRSTLQIVEEIGRDVLPALQTS
ncbi:TIGR03571 family LLM class oxidoreductase [Comamonas sp. Tr-654]|uniref:TIGR03571 family LLM class oxidoreductase n=1 Tax=Comamonas sp. Tr-654 TaxID=2608341 RepID=UPI00141E4571|nr:TIGR03571 family LLM class oxidoreductase [Comamonas sp. Tr-654]NIF85798.1 TIGR03571 family LLM class oxidoreductase [Comamonas sp. Tr-654]